MSIEQVPEALRAQGADRRDPQGFRRRGNGQAVGVSYRSDPAAQSSFVRHSEAAQQKETSSKTVKIYPYGVARNRLIQAVKHLRVPAAVIREAGEADVLVTLRSYYRKRQQTVVDAENRGIPIFVLRANTIKQMERFLMDLFDLTAAGSAGASEDQIIASTRAAINEVLNGERWVELPPASSYLRRVQHEMARNAELVSHSYGKEPYRRVRIFREG